MPKGRGSKKKGRKATARNNSSLEDHRRHKKTLTPPLMQIPKMVSTSWPHTGLPECIWIAAVAEKTRVRAAAHAPLDVLDEFVPPEETDVLDGRISRFVLVPEDKRTEARAALRERAPFGLPEDLGHAVALYPECPAFWLYEDWLTENEPDHGRGVAYLKKLVAPMIPSREQLSAELRLMVIARRVKAGKFRMAPDIETAELLSKYPTYLDADGRAQVESFVRATWNGIIGISDDGDVAEHPWGRYFWQRSYTISSCEWGNREVEIDEIDEEDIPDNDAAGTSQQEPSVWNLSKSFAQALKGLGEELRALQAEAELNTFDTETDEVKLGLASRAFRLLRNFLMTPLWWTNEMAPHLIRSMVDERIITAWLLKQDDPALYVKFKEYGRGKRKLLKLKLEDLMDSDRPEADEDAEQLHARLEAEVNQDTMEEFLEIDLGGTFSGKNIREMAKETDLADLYSLSYQPLSAESHGEWGSLVMFDLEHCANPLHLYHRLGSFDTNEHSYIHLGWARTAIDLTEDVITEIFSSLGLDAGPAFEVFRTTVQLVAR